MVVTQIAARGLSDLAVLEAMRWVPREEFVESGFEEFAYGLRRCRLARNSRSRIPTLWR